MIDILRETLLGMVESLITSLPSVMAGLVVLLIGYILARVLARLVEQTADRLGLDSVLDKIGVGDNLRQANITQSSGVMVGQLIFWIIFLNFLLAALRTIGLSEAVEPLENLINFLPRVLIGLATLVAGLMLARFVGRTAEAAMAGMGVEFHQSLGTMTRILLSIIVTIIVLQMLGMDVTLLNNVFTNILTLAFAGIALAFALGGRDIARNVLAGYYARELFVLGDRLEIDGQEGTLEAIGTMNAEIAVGAERLVVPNRRLTDEAVRIAGPPTIEARAGD